MRDVYLVYTTLADEKQAQAMANTLVEEGLAACCTQTKCQSTYRWEGKICCETEIQLTIKTTRDRREDLEWRLGQLHPYDCPEILSVAVGGGATSYLRWIGTQVQPPSTP